MFQQGSGEKQMDSTLLQEGGPSNEQTTTGTATTQTVPAHSPPHHSPCTARDRQQHTKLTVPYYF